MALRARPTRSLATPAPPRNDPKRAWSALKRYVDDRVRRSTEVEWARIAPHCDGGPALDFLEDIACSADPSDVAGPLVLANRQNGIPTLLSDSLARPFQGTGGIPIISTGEYSGPGVGSGDRFFVDQSGYIYEGRNYGYHAGPGTPPVANGTYLDINSGTFPTHAMDYSWGTDGSGEAAEYWREKVFIGGTTVWIAYYPGSGHSPAWDGYSWAGSEYHDGGVEAPQGWLRPLLGLSASVEPGYRDSSAFIAAVEFYFTGAAFTSYQIGVSTRNATTLELISWTALPAVTAWIQTDGPAARFATERSSGRYWRAGITLFPVSDGTWVLSVEDSNRAWVMEWDAAGSVLTALETVDFTGHDVTGYVTVSYGI